MQRGIFVRICCGDQNGKPCFWLLWMAFDSIQFGVGDQSIIGKELHNIIRGKIHNMLISSMKRNWQPLKMHHVTT